MRICWRVVSRHPTPVPRRAALKTRGPRRSTFILLCLRLPAAGQQHFKPSPIHPPTLPLSARAPTPPTQRTHAREMSAVSAVRGGGRALGRVWSVGESLGRSVGIPWVPRPRSSLGGSLGRPPRRGWLLAEHRAASPSRPLAYHWAASSSARATVQRMPIVARWRWPRRHMISERSCWRCC